MVDNDHRDLLSQPVEHFKKLLSDGRRKSLKWLIEQ